MAKVIGTRNTGRMSISSLSDDDMALIEVGLSLLQGVIDNLPAETENEPQDVKELRASVALLTVQDEVDLATLIKQVTLVNKNNQVVSKRVKK